MKIFNYNPTTGLYKQFLESDIQPLTYDKELVLACDQSTKSSGIVIGTPQGRPLIFMALIKEDSVEVDVTTYKENFKRIIGTLIKNLNLKAIIHEDTFTQGFVKMDEVLSALKVVFKELVIDFNMKTEIIQVKQQIWKSIFLSKFPSHKQQTKENVQFVAKQYLPSLLAPEDVYDAFGIYFYYATTVYQTSDIFKVYKGMKIERVHKLFIDMQQVNSIHNFEFEPFTEELIQKYGIRQFDYLPNMIADDVCRCLTSASNKVWWAEVPEDKYIDVNWWRFNIIPNPQYKIIVVCHRINPTNKNDLDRRV